MPFWKWASTGSSVPTFTVTQTATSAATNTWWTNSSAQTAATTTSGNPWASLVGNNQTAWAVLDELESWTNNNATNAYTRLVSQSQLAQIQQAQLAQANQPAYERYQFALYRPTGLGHNSLAAPGLITHQEQARRDEELYRQALAESNEQEAARILRLIEQREQTVAAQRAAIEARQQRQQEEQQQQLAARERANQLLLEHLTSDQRDTFTRNGWFMVEGGKSKTRYRIRAGTLVGNIDVLDPKDKMTHRLCGHVSHNRGVPIGDHLLAQKMMLQYDEDAFLRIANRH